MISKAFLKTLLNRLHPYKKRNYNYTFLHKFDHLKITDYPSNTIDNKKRQLLFEFDRLKIKLIS